PARRRVEGGAVRAVARRARAARQRLPRRPGARPRRAAAPRGAGDRGPCRGFERPHSRRPRGDRRMTGALRVCFLCNEYPPGPHGGIGTLTRTLARALVAIGHEARAVGIYPHDYPAPDIEEEGGVRVWRLRASPGRGGWLRSRARLFQTVAAWVRTGDVDLVEVPDWE